MHLFDAFAPGYGWYISHVQTPSDRHHYIQKFKKTGSRKHTRCHPTQAHEGFNVLHIIFEEFILMSEHPSVH